MNRNLVNLTPEEILNKEFRIDTRGYRLKEVDQFLDEIIADYQTFNKIIMDLQNEKEEQAAIILNLKQEIRDLKTTVEITKTAASHDDISGSNLDILKRLSSLEKAVFGKDEYRPLEPEQVKGLEHILGLLSGREQELLDLRYREGMTQEECGSRFNFSHSRAGQVEQATLRKLRHPHRIAYVRDGYAQTELGLKIACAEEMKRCLEEQKKRYPLMNEEDVVKFAFQGMLGVGHLMASEEQVLESLKKEMDAVEADPDHGPAIGTEGFLIKVVAEPHWGTAFRS